MVDGEVRVEILQEVELAAHAGVDRFDFAKVLANDVSEVGFPQSIRYEHPQDSASLRASRTSTSTGHPQGNLRATSSCGYTKPAVPVDNTLLRSISALAGMPRDV